MSFKKAITRILFYFWTMILGYCNLNAQTIVVGCSSEEDLRNQQLEGRFDSSYSFTVRPIDIQKLISWKKVDFHVSPVTLIQQYNSHHPYGWNDGAMIPTKGYQMFLRTGFNCSFGIFDLNFNPEFVYARNNDFQANELYGSNALIHNYFKAFGGQSSFRISLRNFSLGVSTENLWWGPGIRSSLLMSNNAPGFFHAFFKSKKPIKTFIGSFEWQLVGGKLLGDSSQPFENYNLQKPRIIVNNDWRYFSAYVISYHPKWVPGLFLGMTRFLQSYHQDVVNSSGSFLNKYIPVISKAFQKQNAQGDDTMRTDQLASFFLRWVLPKAKSEFYFEWGYNDYNQNIRDYLLSPTHSAANIVGFKKIFEIKKDSSYIDFNIELTQLSQSPDYLIREAGNWYVHGDVRQGYTNENQIMGAGAGLGCNVQSIKSKWIKGIKQIGILLERVERNPQYQANKWIDYSIGFEPQLKYRNIIFNGIFQFINSTNYAWEQGINRFNFHARLAFTYMF